MKVTIKSFDVQMELKNNGIELEVRSPSGADFLGDLVVTKTQLIWCPGKTSREKGISISIPDFIKYMDSL